MLALRCLPVHAVGAQSPAVAAADSTPPYAHVSLREYAARVAGPRAIGRIVLFSGVDQAMGRPRERDKTWRGFEDRLATRAAQQTIATTVLLGLSATFAERPARFTLCSCTGRDARLAHALTTPWRVETPHGTVWSALVPVTEVTSALLVTTVEPRGFSWGEGLRAGATGLLASSALSAVREFWPWHRRPPGW